MEDWVQRSLARWPNVPALFGWLALDRRGRWLIQGELISRPQIIETINRNYAADEQGRWYFQNGPQRVFVELEATPLIWRVNADHSLHDQLGRAARWQSCWLDEQGRLYLQTDTGFGLVHSMDTGYAADAIEQGRWPLQDVLAADLPLRFGYVMSPQLQQQA